MSKELHNQKILLVDDAVPTLAVMAKTLSNIGYKNLRACNHGKQALAELKQAKASEEPFDIIVCDWYMPEMSGLELLQEIRETNEFGDVIFIMVTSESDAKKIITAIEAGANAYIVKPVAAEQVSEKIEKVLAEREQKRQTQ